MGNKCYKSSNSVRKELQSIINTQKEQIEKLKQTNYLLRCKKESLEQIATNDLLQNNTEIVERIKEHKKNRNYKYLVFSGGAIKGITYCGALDVLRKEIDLSQIKGYAGTSVGSIASALLAIGYNYDEIVDILYNLDYSKILDDKWGVVRDAINFLKDYGWAPGNHFYKILGEWVEKKTGNPDYTIDQLYKDTGITLVLVGVDLNRKMVQYFYPNHHDESMRNVPIRKAIRISMSIPWVFEPVKFNDAYCVDGGVLDTFPLHAFDGDYPGDPNARMNLCKPNPEVLGLNIVASSDLDELYKDKKEEINNIFEYAMSYIDLYLKETEKRFIVPTSWYRTINIVVPNIPSSKFDLSSELKQKLIDAGHDYTKQFFNCKCDVVKEIEVIEESDDQ